MGGEGDQGGSKKGRLGREDKAETERKASQGRGIDLGIPNPGEKWDLSHLAKGRRPWSWAPILSMLFPTPPPPENMMMFSSSHLP